MLKVATESFIHALLLFLGLFLKMLLLGTPEFLPTSRLRINTTTTTTIMDGGQKNLRLCEKALPSNFCVGLCS